MEIKELLYHIAYTLSFEFFLPPLMDWIHTMVTMNMTAEFIYFVYMPHILFSHQRPSPRPLDKSIIQYHCSTHALSNGCLHHAHAPLQSQLYVHIAESQNGAV